MTGSTRRDVRLSAAVVAGLLLLVWATVSGPPDFFGSGVQRFQADDPVATPSAAPSAPTDEPAPGSADQQPRPEDVEGLGDLLLWTAMLLLVGSDDVVMPPALSRRLYELARGPKQRLWVTGSGHNDLSWVAGERYWAALRTFADSLPGGFLMDPRDVARRLAKADVPFQAISESTRDDLAERGIDASHVEVIYPGIDTVGFTPAPGLRSPNPLFAYLGRLKKYKGVHLVIEAFARVTHPAAILEIAGAGDFRPALERLARSLDLDGRVRFLGRISEADKLALLRRSWALAFASPKEGWGITNLEAAACGTPVVASNSPGIRESVRHGETGYLVRHGDVVGMAEAMNRLAGDQALVERLGQEARRFAESFTWERAAAETEQHLLDSIQGGSR